MEEEIVYYITLKEFPNYPIGSQITLFGEGKHRASFGGGKEIPCEWLQNTEWFRPVYLSEYKDTFKSSCISIIMKEACCSTEKANEIFESMFNK